MTSVQPKGLIDRYSSLLQGRQECLTGICRLPVTIALVHGIAPRLGVVVWPIVEQEPRRLFHRVDEDKSARDVRVDDNRNAKSFRGHHSPYSSIEAKERWEGGHADCSPSPSKRRAALRRGSRLMLAPAKREANRHTGLLDSVDEVCPRQAYACRSQLGRFTAVHRIGPELTVVAGPVVEKEIRRFPHGGNQVGNPRIDAGNGNRSLELSCAHGSSCLAIAAEVSALDPLGVRV